ncbi:MAG: type III pantothenate kinase, partial [Planctomycetota bacterium]
MIAPFAKDPPEQEPSADSPELSKSAVAVIDVGNASIACGAWDQMSVYDSRRVPTGDRRRFSAELERLCSRFSDGRPAAVVVASVVPDALAWIGEIVAELANRDIAVIGGGVPLPIPVAVRDPQRVGVDRVCSAAAAFDRTGHACTVIDFGTAVTVDLVDDAGTFVGGAILPGARLQAQALARGTAALPEVDPVPPSHP